MRIFNKKILFAKRKRFTFLVSIADFSSQECYEIYFQFSLTDPWWLPKYEPEFGKSKIPLYGWLFFYFGRRSIGVLIPSENGSEPIIITVVFGGFIRFLVLKWQRISETYPKSTGEPFR